MGDTITKGPVHDGDDDDNKKSTAPRFLDIVSSSGSGSGNSKDGLGAWLWRRGGASRKKLGSQDISMRHRNGNGNGNGDEQNASVADGETTEYRTYKRRWFGLVQLTLMNIIVSWDWLTFAPVASKAAAYYDVPESTINWISTAFFLAFVAVFPLAVLVLHHSLKLSFLVAGTLILLGNWIRYAGATKASGGSIAHAMAGEVVIGFAQPFILAAPTRYSDLWFTNRGRVAATAVMSLANPLGGALGQLITPSWVSKPSDVSHMVLYISIISTLCTIPALFVPAEPPTPVGPSSKTPKTSLRESFGVVSKSLELWLILIPFAVYVGFFNSISSLLNQMMTPYGFSDDDAGIGGAVLIVVGLVTAAITSPILDRTKKFLLAIRILVPLVALSFLAFVWMPGTRDIAGPYVILAVLGAACFALVPVALEYLIELSHPLSPEVTSTTAWAGGQLFGAIFIIISDALVAGKDASPPRNMKNALIFQAVIAVVVALLPLSLGLFGRRDQVTLRRITSDQRGHHEQAAET